MKAKTYWRANVGRFSLSDMQAHVSADGGDDMEECGGICACESISDLVRNTVMAVLDDDDQIVVLHGRHICDIYDGVRIYPTAVIAEMTKREFLDRLASSDESLYALEVW